MQVKYDPAMRATPTSNTLMMGKRDQEMPAQAHQLVEAVPGDSESQPHKK